MRERRFRLLNVFTVGDERLSGNPLCVFEDADGLSDETMLALARQMNLSETTFLLPKDRDDVSARVRIFTPTFEMPFAGHPTLGTAHVVRALGLAGDAVALSMKVGRVEVNASGDDWTLRAAKSPEVREPAPREALAQMIGVPVDRIGARPLWVDTGAEQLVVPLASPEDVRAARPDAALLAKHGFSEKRGASMVYVWARASDDEAIARFFFLVHGGIVEDPATGSACANLGGWHVVTGHPLPVSLRVHQGEQVKRPSLLSLRVDAQKNIFVGGRVIELARGSALI